MPSIIHPQAQEGFSATKSDFYDKARPPYPQELFSRLRAAVPSRETYDVVEIASGTGTLTRGLLSHPDWCSAIHELQAFEPSPGMRNVFTRTVTDERVSLKDGVFESVNAPDGWADLIVIGTAFHWCSDFDAALKEFARVLKPTGVVALAWNEAARNRKEWVSRLFSIGLRYDQEGFVNNDKWRVMDKTPLYSQLFEPYSEQFISHDVIGPTSVVTDRVLSWSAIATLSDEEKARIGREVEEVITNGDGIGLEWVDEEHRTLKFPHDSRLVTMRRKKSFAV